MFPYTRCPWLEGLYHPYCSFCNDHAALSLISSDVIQSNTVKSEREQSSSCGGPLCEDVFDGGLRHGLGK